jgi:SPP1 family holin
MQISKGTIARTISIVLVLVNIVLKQFGIDAINVSESEILSFIEALIEVAIIVVSFWKNNSFTQNAIKADDFLKTLKEGK